MNLKDMQIKDFSDLIYSKIKELNYNVILTYPTVEGKYPCVEMHTPLKSVDVTENANPVFSTFRISITVWNAKQRDAMVMTSNIDTKLRDYNLIRVSTSTAIYDDIVQKYGITSTYEVKYNSITNSFKFIN